MISGTSRSVSSKWCRRCLIAVTVQTKLFLLWGIACVASSVLMAQDDAKALRNHIPKPGMFPPAGAGILMDGDLIVSDPINRRGALRKGQHSRRHYFAMLPYGLVRFHGSPADIRDIPSGIHMHGRFLLPMEGEEETIPRRNHNHAILLEDDVSFYTRQGRSWKVVGIEQGGGPDPRLKLSVEPIGPEIEGGINEPTLFDINDGTRIWKDRQLVKRDQITPGLEVQVNLKWGPFDTLETTDVWLDDESLSVCQEIQRQKHLRLIRTRFLPGWIDAVQNNDTGGGEITVTFFGGMDPSLYSDIRDMKGRPPRICNAENTLRTWTYHQEHASPATIIQWSQAENPPPGSSGVQARFKVKQMLDGFRTGRVVRVKGPWTYVLLPFDECITNPAELERSRKMILP